MTEFRIEKNTPPETYTDRQGEVQHSQHRYFTTRYRGVWYGMKTKFYPTPEQATKAIHIRTENVRATLALLRTLL